MLFCFFSFIYVFASAFLSQSKVFICCHSKLLLLVIVFVVVVYIFFESLKLNTSDASESLF